MTFPAGVLKKLGLSSYHQLLEHVFGFGGAVALGAIQEKTWNFFPWSAVGIDATGTLALRLGLNEKGETHVSVTGQGCKHVRSWPRVQAVLEQVGARLTRVDIAIDDFRGERINLGKFVDLVNADAFTSSGRPPLCQFIDDFDSGKGKTLYVGQRGYKQLCVYEKGKQLGDPNSPYCRAELRLYSKHHVISYTVLTDPGAFFGGAYECLREYVIGEMCRLEMKERQSRPTAEAMLESLQRQAGRSIGMLRRHFDDETFLKIISEEIAREGRPGRFKSYVGDPGELLRRHVLERHQKRLASLGGDAVI